jgi:hypothetical protein
MTRSRLSRIGAALVLALATTATTARADLFRDIGVGLGYAGFNLEGNRNILSGGADFRISRNLVGNTLDFGSADLTVLGPISLELSTGGRWLSNLDINLQTAMTGDLASSPLAYVFNYDVGGQSAEVSGSILIDAGFSMNGFGFYDLELMYSSRQDVQREGRFSDSEDTYDFDVGPINVSGNIFADALALITTPFFEATGHTNPFDSFSGRTQLQKLIEGSDDLARQQLAAGDSAFDVPLSPWSALGMVGEPVPASAGMTDAAGVVPEPTVLLLMLLGIPMVVRRRRRRASALH